MSAVLTLWHKQMMKLSVHKEEAVGILFQPILWIVLFGTGMKGVFGAAMPGGDDLYITFMVPGIIALTAMSGAIQGGLVLLEERLRGFIKEYLAAPIPRISILIGNILSTVTKSLIQVIIIIAVGALMGSKFGPNPIGWLGGLVIITIFGLAFSGIGLAVASRTSSTGAYHMLIFMLTLPLLFVSNALYPLASLPTWMQILSRINPVSYMVDGLRQMVFESGATLAGGDLLPLWLCFVVVAAYAIFGILLASVSFKKSIR